MTNIQVDVRFVYGLLPIKTQKTCMRFFRLLKDAAMTKFHIQIEPDHALMDFEVAARNALTAFLLFVEVNCCYFH